LEIHGWSFRAKIKQGERVFARKWENGIVNKAHLIGDVFPALRFASYWIKHALLRGIFDFEADRADVANAADGIKMLRIFGND
jgi:hypothetical protein